MVGWLCCPFLLGGPAQSAWLTKGPKTETPLCQREETCVPQGAQFTVSPFQIFTLLPQCWMGCRLSGKQALPPSCLPSVLYATSSASSPGFTVFVFSNCIFACISRTFNSCYSTICLRIWAWRLFLFSLENVFCSALSERLCQLSAHKKDGVLK